MTNSEGRNEVGFNQSQEIDQSVGFRELISDVFPEKKTLFSLNQTVTENQELKEIEE
jgi:hypothetical protein